MQDDESKQIGINRQVSLAVAGNLSRCSVGFFDVESPTVDLASGVLISIGNRLFVATAGHAVPSRPSGRISFIGQNEKRLVESKEAVIAHESYEWPDVGFLEIAPDVASRLGKEPIGLERISPRGPGHFDRRCFVFGYPTDSIKVQHKKERFDLGGISYSHLPMRPEEWPEKPRPPAHEEVDIFLPYDRDEEMFYYEENQGRNELGHPEGMSGGGLWQGVDREGKLWTPEDVGLFGIQSGYRAEDKYLRACQINTWLRLLHSEQLDLRATLEEAFPSLQF